MLATESVRWKGRDVTRLTNGLVELIALRDGGHLAEFRFVDWNGFPSQNVLWEAPWMVSGSDGNRLDELSQTAGFTGHALCLDYFGPPSADEAASGLPIHGEAGAERWDVHGTVEGQRASCQWNAQLLIAQLRFERKIRLCQQEAVAYVEETVTNARDVDHACHWVQHATFAPPFLNPEESTLAVSATRGMTSPLDYPGGSLLANNREFTWPLAPRADAAGDTVDLRCPFSAMGRGFVAAVLLDPRRKVEFMVAINWKLRLGVGYCFRRDDFPWMAIWEENCARPGAPWNGTTQARGMEFGTTPLPLGREEILRRGDIFETPGWCVIPASGKRTARYLIFIFTVPAEMDSIQNVEAKGDTIVLSDERAKSSFSIPARGCGDFLAPGDKLTEAVN